MKSLENVQKQLDGLYAKKDNYEDKLDETNNKIKLLEKEKKTINDKKRTHRLILWGAETLYHFENTLKIDMDPIYSLSDEDIKKIVGNIFSNQSIRDQVKNILKQHSNN